MPFVPKFFLLECLMYTFLLVLIYIAFISLGLPDSVLGAAWPSMRHSLGVPEGYAGVVTMLIYTGTVISSMATGWLNQRLGAGKVVASSVALTAVALWGFSCSSDFTQLCLWALPYGLGGGCVDATLNNYVVLHYKPRHTSFLHCFWGVGTIISPLVMGAFLARGGAWTQGYQAIAIFQVALVAVLLLSLPLWRKANEDERADALHAEAASSSPTALLRLPGVKSALTAFFCYTAIESSVGLWATSYMIEAKGIELITATRLGMLFFLGIMLGRIISGFISERLGDVKLVKMGLWLAMFSFGGLLLPLGSDILSFASLVCLGIGCGPIFPCMIHYSPSIVGAARSQALIGMEVAAASAGSILMPAAFGLIVQHVDISLLPCYGLLFVLVLLLLVKNMMKYG